MPMVFLSYRAVDRVAADRLKHVMEQHGHDVWMDHEKIDIGNSIVAEVSQGLTRSAYLVLCLSGSGTSAWMDREWMSTLERQLSGAAVRILPVRLTGGRPPALLADLRYADLADRWDDELRMLLRAIR